MLGLARVKLCAAQPQQRCKAAAESSVRTSSGLDHKTMCRIRSQDHKQHNITIDGNEKISTKQQARAYHGLGDCHNVQIVQTVHTNSELEAATYVRHGQAGGQKTFGCLTSSAEESCKETASEEHIITRQMITSVQQHPSKSAPNIHHPDQLSRLKWIKVLRPMGFTDFQKRNEHEGTTPWITPSSVRPKQQRVFRAMAKKCVVCVKVSVTIFRDLNIRYNNQNHVYNNSLLLNF